MSDTAESSNVANTPQAAPASGSFSLKRVLLTVLAIVALSGITIGGVLYLQNLEPTLYPVKGVAYLDGEPIPEGTAVLTKHARGFTGAVGEVGKDGQFELTTDLKEGAYAGEHTITVFLTNGAFPPVSLIPDKYSDVNQTPFKVTVDAHTQDQELKLELFGRIDAPARPAGGFTRPGVPTTPSEPEENGTEPDKTDQETPDSNNVNEKPSEPENPEKPADSDAP